MKSQPNCLHCWSRSLGPQAFWLIAAGLSITAAMLNNIGAQAAPEGIVYYSQRLEAMFKRLDLNGDGKLDAEEVQGQIYLYRRLHRKDSRGYLLLEDLQPRGSHPNGRRLQRRFRQADTNGNGKLNRDEAASIPWLANNFNSLDLNDDNVLTMHELWLMQLALAPRRLPHPHPHQHNRLDWKP